LVGHVSKSLAEGSPRTGTTKDGRPWPARPGNYARIAAGKAEATEARMEGYRPALVDTARMTVRAAADELTHRGIAGKVWHPTTVARARKRLGLTVLPTSSAIRIRRASMATPTGRPHGYCRSARAFVLPAVGCMRARRHAHNQCRS